MHHAYVEDSAHHFSAGEVGPTDFKLGRQMDSHDPHHTRVQWRQRSKVRVTEYKSLLWCTFFSLSRELQGVWSRNLAKRCRYWGWFGVVVTKLSYVELSLRWFFSPLACLPSQLLRPLRRTQLDRWSVGRCNKYWRWFRPPLGKNGECCVVMVPVTACILAYCMSA